MKQDLLKLEQADAAILERAENVHERLNNRELWQLLPIPTLIKFGISHPKKSLASFMQTEYPRASRPRMSNKQLNIVALALALMIGPLKNTTLSLEFHSAADEMENNKDKENFFGIMIIRILALGLIASDIEFTFGQLEDRVKPSSVFGPDAIGDLVFFRMMTTLLLGMNIFLFTGFLNSMHPQKLEDLEKDIRKLAATTEAEKQYFAFLRVTYRELSGITKPSLFDSHVYFTNLNKKVERFLKPVFYGAGAYQAFNLSPVLAPLIPLAYIVKFNNDQSTWKDYGKAALSLSTYAYVAFLTYNLPLLDSFAKNHVNGSEDKNEFQDYFKASVAACVGMLSMLVLNQSYKICENPIRVSNEMRASVSNGVRNTMNFAYDRLSSVGRLLGNSVPKNDGDNEYASRPSL